MTLYFYHLETQDGVITDHRGEEFDLLQEAKGAALFIASELARNQADVAGQHILITDASGLVLFRTPVRLQEF
jgi:hypothetical protein